MTTKAQKIRLGAFTIATGGLLLLVLVVFGGLRLWERHDRYYVVFEDSVLGLQEGAEVTFAGIKIGSVAGVALAPDDPRKIRVALDVKRGLPIRTDTTATLTMAGITGLRVIDLKGGAAGTARLPPGSVITLGETTLGRLERQAKTLVDQSTEIMDRANQVMANLEAITQPRQYRTIEELFTHAAAAAVNLDAASADLRVMVAENRTALRTSLAAVEQTAATASKLFEKDVPRLVGNATSFVDDLRGVLRTNQTHLGSAMFDLRQASRSFKELARDLRQRPSRLLMSSAPAGRQLP